jgi:hypothetical protein
MKFLLLSFGLIWSAPAFPQSSYAAPVRNFIAFDRSVVAFTHCILIDVISLKARPDQTVVIRNGVISTIGTTGGTPLPTEWVFKHGIGFDSRKLFENVKGQVGKF